MEGVFIIVAWIAAWLILVIILRRFAGKWVLAKFGVAIVLRSRQLTEVLDSFASMLMPLRRRLFAYLLVLGGLYLMIGPLPIPWFDYSILLSQPLVYLLARNVYEVVIAGFGFEGVEEAAKAQRFAPVVPLLPLLTIPLELLAAFIVAIALAVIVHELSHGVVARLFGLRVRSVGLFSVLGFLNGAFVEPDEEDFRAAPSSVRASIIAAGPVSNIVTALLVILLFYAFFHANPAIFGVRVDGIVAGGPMHVAGITNGTVIYGVSGCGVQTNIITSSQLLTTLYVLKYEACKPGDEVIFYTEGGARTVVLGKDGEYPYFGIVPTNNISTSPLSQLFIMTYIINIGLALVNILPIYPLDGGQLIASLISRWKYAKHAVKALTATTMFMLLVSLVYSLPFFGIFSALV